MSRATDTFRAGWFEEVDRPALVSHVVCLTLGALVLAVVWRTPVKPFEDLTLDQLPDRITRLLLNESDLARLSAPERAALPPEAVMRTPDGEAAEPTTESEPEPTVKPPSDAVGLPGSEPEPAGGTGAGSGAKGVAVAAGVAKAVAATGALAEVDRIVGDFTGVVASGRGSKALRQGGSGGGVERRTGTPGAKARSGADAGGVDEILGSADGGAGGGRGSAGTAAGLGGGGGSGRAQVRIAAPSGVDGATSGASGRSTSALMTVVQRHAAAVRFCYNRLLQKKPGASGQVIVRLSVAANGGVSDAQIVKSTLSDSELESCVLAQAREWRFMPSEEARFTFDVPFVFTPPSDN